jgi:hypothetical protein
MLQPRTSVFLLLLQRLSQESHPNLNPRKRKLPRRSKNLLKKKRRRASRKEQKSHHLDGGRLAKRT